MSDFLSPAFFNTSSVTYDIIIGKYSEKRAIRYCRQLASAIHFMHKNNITHRDLKPENVLMTSTDLDYADLKVHSALTNSLVSSNTYQPCISLDRQHRLLTLACQRSHPRATKS